MLHKNSCTSCALYKIMLDIFITLPQMIWFEESQCAYSSHLLGKLCDLNKTLELTMLTCKRRLNIEGVHTQSLTTKDKLNIFTNQCVYTP